MVANQMPQREARKQDPSAVALSRGGSQVLRGWPRHRNETPTRDVVKLQGKPSAGVLKPTSWEWARLSLQLDYAQFCEVHPLTYACLSSVGTGE